jgi:hypothetical protein
MISGSRTGWQVENDVHCINDAFSQRLISLPLFHVQAPIRLAVVICYYLLLYSNMHIINPALASTPPISQAHHCVLLTKLPTHSPVLPFSLTSRCTLVGVIEASEHEISWLDQLVDGQCNGCAFAKL